MKQPKENFGKRPLASENAFDRVKRANLI